MKEMIILAGGLGTRLRSTVADLPKSMAPVAGRPFIDYVLEYFTEQKVEKFIFALGHQSEVLQEYIQKNYADLHVSFSIESEALGTGGAINLACTKVTEQNVLVTNGDTLFKVDVALLEEVHVDNQSECTLALKPMIDFDRFGVVALGDNNCITSFKEKKYYTQGLINGGVYALNVGRFQEKGFPEKFSFEKDYLERYVGEGGMFGSRQDVYFIDMGIPQDYNRAQEELGKSDNL